MLGRKWSLVSIKKVLYQCHSTYTRWVKSHRVLYLSLLGSYNICIIYLRVLEACLNVTIVMLYFFHLKNISNVFHNIWSLWIPSLYIFEKKGSLLTYMRNKCVMREVNLYFLTLWKMVKFFLQKFFVFNMITVSKEIGNIRTCKVMLLQKLIKFTLSG